MPRKLANIDGDQVRRLATLGCTYREIGAWFGVDESTVRKRFSAEKEQGEENGKTKLRWRQFKRAMEGSDTMLIHLGKHRLGQTDKQEIDIKNSGNPIQVVMPDNGRDPDTTGGAAVGVPGESS